MYLRNQAHRYLKSKSSTGIPSPESLRISAMLTDIIMMLFTSSNSIPLARSVILIWLYKGSIMRFQCIVALLIYLENGV